MRRTWQRLVASLRPAVDDAPIVAAAGSLTVADVVRRFWPRLRPLRWWLALALLLLAAAPAIEVVEILLFQRLVDDVLVPAVVAAADLAGDRSTSGSTSLSGDHPGSRRLPLDVDLPTVPARPAHRRVPARPLTAPAARPPPAR